MHVHENVAERGDGEEELGKEIVRVVKGVIDVKDESSGAEVEVEVDDDDDDGREHKRKDNIHVELRNVAWVKRFKPGVKHVVFDVWVGPEGEGGALP